MPITKERDRPDRGQYKITISYDNGNKYYVTGGLKVEGLGSTELNTYGDDTTTG